MMKSGLCGVVVAIRLKFMRLTHQQRSILANRPSSLPRPSKDTAWVRPAKDR